MNLFFRRMLAVMLAFMLFSAAAVSAQATENAAEEYIRQILNYYQYYQEEADAEINDLFAQLESVAPEKAELWRQIMDNWSRTYDEMPVYRDVLPDGLPEDDSLCIVVMGYRLNENGTLREELMDRMTVAYHSAVKYPNAWILCTGGETSNIKGITEGQQMAQFLTSCGIDRNRILVEQEALSTTENAQYSVALLEQYPQIRSLAVVTSDYHVRRSCLMFYAAGLVAGRELQVTSNAVCKGEDNGGEGIETQAWGLAILAGVEWEDMPAPQLHRQIVEETAATEVLCMTEAEPETPQKKSQVSDAAALLGLLAFVMLILPKWFNAKERLN